MADIDGVVNVVPVPKTAPPVDSAYQLIVPALAVADKSSVPEPHLLDPVTLVIVGGDEILAVTAVRVEEVQVPATTDST